MLYEAVFTTVCGRAFEERRRVDGELALDRVHALRQDRELTSAAAFDTTSTATVKKRLSGSRDIVGAL